MHKSDSNLSVSIENLPELLTLREVAKLFRVSVLTVKRWEKRGTLIPIRINARGDRRYVQGDIRKLFNSRGNQESSTVSV